MANRRWPVAGSWSRRRAITYCLLLGALVGSLLAAAPVRRSTAQGGHGLPAAVEDNGQEMLLPDSLFLYDSSVLHFDTQTFLESQPGPLAGYVEQIDGTPWTAAESIAYNAVRHGLNPQLILILLETQSQALSDANAPVPLSSFAETPSSERGNFHAYVKQLAEQLMMAFDAHRYGRPSPVIVFPSGERFALPEAPNAGTYAIQATLATSMPPERWALWVLGPDPSFTGRYGLWFGDPSLEPERDIVKETAAPTGYILPFPIGETWYYTGGPHYYGGGLPGCISGVNCRRPWSAIDLAQPELISCPNGYYPAHRWIVAAKGGTVIQSSQALIVIDHGDGWRTYYSHVATAGRRGTGPVERGDVLGHPSCEVEPGGFTTGVHVHFALYQVGAGFVDIDGRILSGWAIGESSHYNGTMQLGSDVREASTGRHSGINDVLNGGVGAACPQSGGVILYKHVNYDCDGDGPGSGYVLQSEAGFYDLPGPFDDRASSIRVPPARSVRVYEHSGRRGASACLSGDDPNFTDDFFDGEATILNDRVSSIELFDVADCAGPYEGGSWAATYYSDPELATPCAGPTPLDGAYIFRDWANENPSANCPADNWSARFSRHAYFPGGAYTFGLASDQRARLKVNGETVIDKWSGAGPDSVTRTITAGSYEVMVEYANMAGVALLSAWWRGPGYPSLPDEGRQPEQWYARYWANQSLTGDPVISINEGVGPLRREWGDEGPGYGLPADRFSGRYERQVWLGCGSYRFRIHTDDGVRLWIDDQLLLDAWFDQVGDHEILVDLAFGQHQLKVEHYENGGRAAIMLDWFREVYCSPSGALFLPLIQRSQN